ncbi:UBN2 domain-containing protein [Cephalotus follicularis]|uniref:UBN2 domain-containing protein n=1 Tax=Cephalotus follicularis TaxID=3775 RepID=A0A1Q3D0H6_CEPFO|nr:UBN2 domain-containing protein [Cephalotus follicularis]
MPLFESTLSLVVGKHTFVEAWSTLNQAFGAPSHAHILQLHMQLQNLKKNGSSISTYHEQAKYLADELAAAGKILSTEYLQQSWCPISCYCCFHLHSNHTCSLP